MNGGTFPPATVILRVGVTALLIAPFLPATQASPTPDSAPPARSLAVARAAPTGIPTSLMESDGSGDMTVLAEKFTLLPERFDLNLPSLPFNLWTRVLSGRPDLCLAGGIPDVWLSKYVVI